MKLKKKIHVGRIPESRKIARAIFEWPETWLNSANERLDSK